MLIFITITTIALILTSILIVITLIFESIERNIYKRTFTVMAFIYIVIASLLIKYLVDKL